MKLKKIALTLATLLVVLSTCVAQQPRTRTAESTYGRLPLLFEANHGQLSSSVKFVSRGPGYSAYLTGEGLTLSLHAKSSPARFSAGSTTATERANLSFRLLGAAKNSPAIGQNQQAAVVNYFVGQDRSKWRRNVPTYAQVRYKNVYRGIDLLYYGNQRQLEYDFEVAPGTDPGQIRFAIDGARQLQVAPSGDLLIDTTVGQIRFHAPTLYQMSDGRRIPIQGGYALDDKTVKFQVHSYDARKRLVIDPVLSYSTYLGGSGDEQVAGMAVDGSGNAYIVGSTDSTDFPLTAFGSPAAGDSQVFLAKIDATGSNLLFCDYLGGSGQDTGNGLALDASNNVYLTGSTASNDFPLVNPFQATYPGSYNAFVAKVSADGSSLLYSTYFGGNGSDVPSGIAVDAQRNIIVAGYTSSTNLPLVSAYQGSVSPNQGGVYGNYGYVTKFSADGSSLLYSTYLGGNSNTPSNCGEDLCWPEPSSMINGLALDINGNAYVAGTTNTYNFPTSAGAYQTTNSTTMNGSIGFVSKLRTGGDLAYSTYLGGNLLTVVTSLAVDGNGSAYVSGLALNDGTFPLTSTSICDPEVQGPACNFAFVSKFDAAGATLAYSTFLGPNNYAVPQAIALDRDNNAYVLSSVTSGSFETVNGLQNFEGSSDLLLVEIDATANSQLFATYLGGSANNDPAPSGIALDADGSIYVSGVTNSPDFPTTSSAWQSFPSANKDAFVMKIASTSEPGVALNPASLAFAPADVGTSSEAQAVLLRNMGNSQLSISSISASGDFTATDTCGNSLAAGGSCTISVTFSPTLAGSRTASLVITDDASGSPHSVSLNGTGNGPSASITPTSLSFGSILLGNSSQIQVLTLTNDGNADLTLSSIQTSGDFSQINDCPAALAPAASCTVSVTFTPSGLNARTGAVTVTDSAPGSPHAANLSGVGTQSSLSITPTSLSFGSVQMGSSSQAQTLTLANAGNAALTVSSIQTSGDFSQTNNCPGTLSPAFSCTVTVTFTPSEASTRSGAVTITDNAPGSPHNATLNGVGTQSSVSITPSSLSFGNVRLGSSGQAQLLTLTNGGNAALTVSSVQTSGDFSQTNDCPATLSPASSCAITVIFTPSALNARTGAVTITDNAPGSPHTASLDGVGTQSSVSITPASLSFGSVAVGSSSQVQAFTLTNSGSADLTINSIQATEDFSETSNCPSTVSPSSQCTVNVTFTASATGARLGTVTVTDNAPGSPHIVTLAGVGTGPSAPSVSITPASLSFGSVALGTASHVQPLTVTNNGNADLSISNVQISGDFSLTNNCPAALSPAATCTINVTFTPTAVNTRSGSVTLTDNAPGSPHVAALSGNGVDFTLSSAATTSTIGAGDTATYTVQVSPVGGNFSGSIALSCTGAPTTTVCSLSPASVTPGTQSTSVVVKVATSAPRASAAAIFPSSGGTGFTLAVQVGFGMLGLVFAGLRSRNKKLFSIVMLTMILAGLVLMTGCAGGTGIAPPPVGGTPPGTYTITVSASSGSLHHSLPLTLNVQ